MTVSTSAASSAAAPPAPAPRAGSGKAAPARPRVPAQARAARAGQPEDHRRPDEGRAQEQAAGDLGRVRRAPQLHGRRRPAAHRLERLRPARQALPQALPRGGRPARLHPARHQPVDELRHADQAPLRQAGGGGPGVHRPGEPRPGDPRHLRQQARAGHSQRPGPVADVAGRPVPRAPARLGRERPEGRGPRVRDPPRRQGGRRRHLRLPGQARLRGRAALPAGAEHGHLRDPRPEPRGGRARARRRPPPGGCRGRRHRRDHHQRPAPEALQGQPERLRRRAQGVVHQAGDHVHLHHQPVPVRQADPELPAGSGDWSNERLGHHRPHGSSSASRQRSWRTCFT